MLKVETWQSLRIWKTFYWYIHCFCCLLFNDGHVFQLWSETDAARKRIMYGLDDIQGAPEKRMDFKDIYFIYH